MRHTMKAIVGQWALWNAAYVYDYKPIDKTSNRPEVDTSQAAVSFTSLNIFT